MTSRATISNCHPTYSTILPSAIDLAPSTLGIWGNHAYQPIMSFLIFSNITRQGHLVKMSAT